MFEDIGGWGEFSGPSASAPVFSPEPSGSSSFWGGWSMPSMPSGSDLMGYVKGTADVFNSITNTKANASIAKAQSDFAITSKKAGLDMDKAVLQGQVNRAKQQADASYMAGQSAFGNGGGGGFSLSPMLLLLLAGGLFLAFKK